MEMAGPTLRDRLRRLYFGHGHVARRFRYGLMAFDIVTISIFLLSTFVAHPPWLVPFEVAVTIILVLDFAARLYAEDKRLEHLLSIATIADVVVIVSLVLPLLTDNLAFLRIARALRLLRSYHLLRDLRSDSTWFRVHEDIIQRTVNLFAFIFIVTSAVFVSQHGRNPNIQNYVDALYFTITTLTTTGFGDITLQGSGGRLLAVIIMVVGVSLFIRLLQAVFRPYKVRYDCPDCGLLVHDYDAVHCKHCGRVLHIPSDGM